MASLKTDAAPVLPPPEVNADQSAGLLTSPSLAAFVQYSHFVMFWKPLAATPE
jgi:hypothetical protein